ncbi:PREDICTED: leucine-rich repeat-containing protein 74B isoform X4 [Condylura cristata]|uniref:leucine-rich repeat-containing protein 74B isoform X4 n=1 Tax=Condylura cristata TaxID=143302 RepID=UPI000642C20F|nr:PREDICTED: leucine-rich repeat-containing protein 74B isoform X4 [Condylura cristata]
MKGPCKTPGGNQEQEKAAAAVSGRPAGVAEAKEDSSTDSDSDLETTRVAHGLGEMVKDTHYLGSCWARGGVLPSCFLRQQSSLELNLRHRGLGPQGAQALASALTSNPHVRRLDLRDNGLCGADVEVLARALSKNSSICGEILGPALAENTGLTQLNISWNHLRGPGAIAFAKGLEANIFLKVLDISYNGLGDSGASAVGDALKANNVLEELNMSNNRISAAGALSLGLGLRVNQTLRILVVSRNPMQSEGCFAVLKSVQDNPVSAIELLDFSNIQVNREFDDLASSMKVILPALCIKTAAHRVEYKKKLLPGSDPK